MKKNGGVGGCPDIYRCARNRSKVEVEIDISLKGESSRRSEIENRTEKILKKP